MRLIRKRSEVVWPVVAVLLLAAGGARGQQYANEIAQAKQFADEGREQIGAIEFEASELGDVGAADVVEARKFFAQYVAQWESAGALFAEGKIDAANKAREAGFKLMRGRDRWRERLTIRRQQLQAAPNAQTIDRERAGVQPQALKQFDQYVEALKALSDAFATWADAITPEATDGELMKYRFKVTEAMAEREIAQARLNWARELAWTRSDRGLSSGIDQKLDALEKVQNEMAQAQRERMRLENVLGAADMDRRRLMDELRALVEANRREREAAAQKKQ